MWCGARTQTRFARGCSISLFFSQWVGWEESGQHLPRAPAWGTKEHLEPFPDSFGFPAVPDVPCLEWNLSCHGTQGLPCSSPSSPSASQCPSWVLAAQLNFPPKKEKFPLSPAKLLILWEGWNSASIGMILVCGSSPQSHGKQGSFCFRRSSCVHPGKGGSSVSRRDVLCSSHPVISIHWERWEMGITWLLPAFSCCCPRIFPVWDGIPSPLGSDSACKSKWLFPKFLKRKPSRVEFRD